MDKEDKYQHEEDALAINYLISSVRPGKYEMSDCYTYSVNSSPHLLLNLNSEDNYLMHSLEHPSLDRLASEMQNHFMNSSEYISLVLESQQMHQNNAMSLENEINCRSSREILRKHFDAWVKVSRESGNKLHRRDREQKINEFLNSIIKKKNELNEKKKNNVKLRSSENISEASSSREDSNKASSRSNTDYGSFHHRYHAQKNIIAFQKAKLQQQERIIEELRLKKIIEDASLTKEVIFDTRKTLKNCERTLIKPKLKCIAGPEEGDDLDYLKLNCMKVPKFLQKMEERAREREEKRAVVRERRHQIELEREKMKEQMELAKQHMDQEEKNRRINEFKEKRRQEQLIAIRNKEIRERLRALAVMADLHYEKKLMNTFGLNALILFMKQIQEDNARAIKHHKVHLLKSHFIGWRNYTTGIVKKRNDMADNMHNLKIWRWVFQQWKMEYKLMTNKRQVAEDWYDFHITERLFIQWKTNTVRIKYQRKKQWEMAIKHYHNCLLWNALGCWQRLPTIHALEREHEARKQRWRLKVQQVVPDFIPRNMDDE